MHGIGTWLLLEPKCLRNWNQENPSTSFFQTTDASDLKLTLNHPSLQCGSQDLCILSLIFDTYIPAAYPFPSLNPTICFSVDNEYDLRSKQHGL